MEIKADTSATARHRCWPTSICWWYHENHLLTVSSILEDAFSPVGPELCKYLAWRPQPEISGPILNERWTRTGSGRASTNSVANRPRWWIEKLRLKTSPEVTEDRVRTDCSENRKAWLRTSIAGSLEPGARSRKLIFVRFFV